MSARVSVICVVAIGTLCAAQAAEIPAKSILLVTMNGHRAADLKRGAQVDGQIARVLGHPEGEPLEGSRFDCTIAAKVIRHPDAGSKSGIWKHLDHWLFDPATRQIQRGAELQSARMTKPDGTIIPLEVTLIDTLEERAPHQSRPSLYLVVQLEHSIPAAEAARPAMVPEVIRGGSEAHLVLTQPLRSTADRPGEEVRAYLLDPLSTGSGQVVPSGAVFIGRVARAQKPRRLWRGGRIQLSFTKLVLPEGGSADISVSISGLEPARQVHAHLGPEGALMSRKPGLPATLVEAGSTYALGKLSDDLFEEGIKAAVSNLSSGAVAASARYFGLAVSAAWLCAHRGSDVYVPAFSKLTATFNRDARLR